MQFLFAKSEAENCKKIFQFENQNLRTQKVKKILGFAFQKALPFKVKKILRILFKKSSPQKSKKIWDFYFKSGRTDKNYHLHFYLTIVLLFDTIGYTLKGQVNSFLGIYIFFSEIFYLHIRRQGFLDM